ncbi:MAG: hypothetical protein DWH82_10655 [Planctomycetota bacterium]|nr:MAG: hypothetical protein DWH82_10655 [Planctomycetota bacterium]
MVIQAMHAEAREHYGGPRIYPELKKRRYATSLNAVAKIMGENCTHSDRGSQYASEHYQRLPGNQRIQCSMSGVGQCGDNAPMESFFTSLEKELVHHEDYETREEAKTSLFEYVEVFYNNQRLQSSLGYLTPVAYEQAA